MSEHTSENDDTTPGEAYYVEHVWSGCAGSAWATLTQATRDGWEHAARLSAQVREALESLDAMCADEDRHGSTIRAHEVRGAVADLRCLVTPPASRAATSITRRADS